MKNFVLDKGQKTLLSSSVANLVWLLLLVLVLLLQQPQVTNAATEDVECTSDLDCGSDLYEAYYCSTSETSLNPTNKCERCHNCLYPSAENENNELSCPERCFCNEHEDCLQGEFCSEGIKECLTCVSCNPASGYTHTTPVGGVCPDTCYCSTANECSDQSKTSYPRSQFCSSWMDGEQDGGVKDAYGRCGLCIECNDKYTVGGSVCSEVCSDNIRCSSTEECNAGGSATGGSTNTSNIMNDGETSEESGWCWMSNEQSKEYGSNCRYESDEYINEECWMLSDWGEQKTLEKEESKGQDTGIENDYYYYYDLGTSLGCPESACNWNVNIDTSYGYNQLRKWYIPYCEENDLALKVHAGYMNGDKSNLSLGDFSKKSKSCDVKRYDAPTGTEFPKTVWAVDCTKIAPSKECKEVKRSIAIWTEAPDGSKSFYKDMDHPLLLEIGGSESCVVDRAISMVAIIIIIIGVIVFGLIGVGCYLWRTRAKSSSGNGNNNNENGDKKDTKKKEEKKSKEEEKDGGKKEGKDEEEQAQQK